ncbi:hypothetical protein INF23_05825 [Ligilactobacillus salivarius]|uniref:hypothetical protein n=1 Tax=Ligilactobacillus salivarius TaxID=1624 RepID=UPI001873AB0A|nr:hypothetical protein [Ligilactobacillus salivarius]MBE5067124.1 hypothetical protein [Ligilactobacillus salivarius]
MIMHLIDKLIYLIVTHWLVLTLVGILACVIPIFYIIGFTDKSVVRTMKYLVALILWLVTIMIFCVKANLDFTNSIKTVSYRVEDYRIKNYKSKACYFLKTNNGTKVIPKDSIKLEENDKKANKIHPIGTVITYKQVVLKNNVPKYRQRLLQAMLESNNEGLQKTIKFVTRNKLVRTNYR